MSPSHTKFINITACRSIQPWLQREDEKSVKHGEQQILQSTTDRSDLKTKYLFGTQNYLLIQSQAGRAVRVYLVRLLLHLLPQLLVERRQVRSNKRNDSETTEKNSIGEDFTVHLIL